MDIVERLDRIALDTRLALARIDIELFNGVFRVKHLSLDQRPDVILKRYTSREKAEDFLLTLVPKPAATKVDC